MKKLVMTLMCLCLCVQISACGLFGEDTEWIKEEAEKIGDDITCGEFVIDGEIFSFPMDLQDIIDKGWHISNNVVNEKTFQLEPGGMSDEFQMFPDDDHEHSIRVSVINVSDKNATVDKCKVATLTVKENNFDYVLPGGINRRSTQDEVEDSYDNAVVEEKDREKIYTYKYTTDEGFVCYVKLSVYNKENANNPLSEVNYWINFEETIGSDDSHNSVDFGENDETSDIEKFIDFTMKASYHNNYAGYVSYGIDTQEGAKELYQSEVEYYVSNIMAYADITEDCVTDETYDEYCEIAKSVLSKVDWEIKDVKDNGDNTYSVEIILCPTNYFDVISDKVDEAIENFNLKYEDVDLNTLTDDEYARVEAEYADAILTVIKGLEKDIEVASEVKKTYKFTDEGFTDSQWEDIDDIIMGIK